MIASYRILVGKEANLKTKPWGDPKTAKILVIGHDPGLQRSKTIAEYCFFADYYFRPKPSQASERAKYDLAASLFGCVRDLTAGQFSDREKENVLITNLCNEVLPLSPRGKTNYIPRDMAEEGLKTIRELLAVSSIRLIFPMSQQVNYWLQKLGFYSTDTRFLEKSEPQLSGVRSGQPYYQPRETKAFKEICGKKYIADGRYYLFPILHIKSYPLKGNFLVYGDNYKDCKKEVKQLVDSFRGEK